MVLFWWGWRYSIDILYRHCVTPLFRPPTAARVSLETLTAELVEIYYHVLPLGQPIPIEVASFLVYDNITMEEDISKAVLRLRLHHDGGPSIMRAKHFRMWLHAAMQEEDPNPGNWDKFVVIIHAAFSGGELVASCAW